MTNTSPKLAASRGKKFVVILVALLAIFATLLIWIAVIQPPAKACVFSSDEAVASSSNQTAAIFAPTANFVDFKSVITRTSTPIKDELGASLVGEDKKNALGRELSIVIADSDPQLVTRKSVKTVEGATEDLDIERAIDSAFGSFNLAANCAAGDLKKADDQIPTSSGVDLLKGFYVAADQLTSEGNKTIFVLGNGIQTSGAILMQEEGVLPGNASAAKKLARELFNRGEVPTMNDITVNWYGIGQVDGEVQKPLPLAKAKALEAFWSEIIRLGGGTVGEICGQCGSGLPNQNAIPVDLVPVNECPITIRLYDADGVEFQPDSSAFVSEAKAKVAAAKTAAEFKSKKGCETLTIRGVAAAGKDKPAYLAERSAIDGINLELTKLRAEAFGSLLKKAGFKGSLTFVGGGTCLTEWGASGLAVPDLQRKCRRVEIY
jgi:hypothetical protein